LKTLKVSGKPQFENDYFITYDQAVHLTLYYKLETMTGGSGGPRTRKKSNYIKLPRQHFSWPVFVDTVTRLSKKQYKIPYINITETEFTFMETTSPPDNVFTLELSNELADLFGFDDIPIPIVDLNNRKTHFKLKVEKMPKPVPDSSTVFYTPHAALKNCEIKVDNEVVFKLTPQYWTINMFKRAIAALNKTLNENSKLSGMSIVDGASQEECTLVLTANKTKKSDAKSYSVDLSDDFRVLFTLDDAPYVLKVDEPLRIPIYFAIAEDDDTPWKTYESEKLLKNNFYPSIDSLITELNEVVAGLMFDIAKQRQSSTIGFTFFSVSDNVVKFTSKAGFSILLTPGLLKLMHLPSSWLSTSKTGTEKVVVKSYRRNHLYIHLDCLDYHYINNIVSNLIKVVPNSAALDEKLQLTFSDPHYYAVAKRYTSNINMYITDSYFDGILKFDYPIAYTLHFRKCPFI